MLLWFSSLSESGFIPTIYSFRECFKNNTGSHLFQRVASFLHVLEVALQDKPADGSHLFQRVASFLRGVYSICYLCGHISFSSLSESGFIPTSSGCVDYFVKNIIVLISFREWLHSYKDIIREISSHLFQRVASFLQRYNKRNNSFTGKVFSSLSESGFIPTARTVSNIKVLRIFGSHLFQRVASFLLKRCDGYKRQELEVLISFREWLHSYL